LALWFLQAPHGLPGKNNRNPLKVAQGQEVVIARDDQIGEATYGRSQDLIVVGIPTDGTSQISRFHALNQGGIAIKQIGNPHTKPKMGSLNFGRCSTPSNSARRGTVLIS
jgi:hypothetical protein